MEKSKFLLFLSLPLLLTSCSNPGTIIKNSLTSSSDENEIKTANIPLNFVFEHVYGSEDNLLLLLYFIKAIIFLMMKIIPEISYILVLTY